MQGHKSEAKKSESGSGSGSGYEVRKLRNSI